MVKGESSRAILQLVTLLSIQCPCSENNLTMKIQMLVQSTWLPESFTYMKREGWKRHWLKKITMYYSLKSEISCLEVIFHYYIPTSKIAITNSLNVKIKDVSNNNQALSN